MMSRVLVFIAALCVSVPALAQTRVATLKASGEIREAFLSPRGDRIGACVGPDRIAIWSLPDGKLLQDVKLPQRPVSMLFAGHDQIVVAFADGAIEVRAIATAATVRRLEAGERQPVLAVSADGRFLASSGTKQIRLWDSSGKLLHTFGHEFGSMSVLAFSPDGNLLVSAGYDAEVHFWDVSTGQRKATLRDRLVSAFAMTFTGDGKTLVIGGADGVIEIIDVAAASIARKFPAEKHAVINVSLSPDGQSIGAAYMDVDGMSRPAPVAVWALASGQVVQRTTSTDTLPFASAFTPDGRWQYATAKGHELTIWVLGKSPQNQLPTPNFQLPR